MNLLRSVTRHRSVIKTSGSRLFGGVDVDILMRSASFQFPFRII